MQKTHNKYIPQNTGDHQELLFSRDETHCQKEGEMCSKMESILPAFHEKRCSLGNATSDWTEREKRDNRRKRLRWFPARRVQAMTPKSSLTVIVQPIASSLTPEERAQDSPASHVPTFPERHRCTIY